MKFLLIFACFANTGLAIVNGACVVNQLQENRRPENLSVMLLNLFCAFLAGWTALGMK